LFTYFCQKKNKSYLFFRWEVMLLPGPSWSLLIGQKFQIITIT
jgi:hypothetical protein